MTAAAVGAVVAAAILALAASQAPMASRPLPPAARPVGAVRHQARLAGRLGAALLPRLGLAPSASIARQLVRAVLVGAVLAPLAPPLAVLVPGLAWTRAKRQELRASAHRRAAVDRALPDVVDLLLLCTSAGMGLPVAHREVAALVPAPLGDALRRAEAHAQRGAARADALVEALAPLGDRARALADLLADHLRYGTPLAPALDRLGLELRLDRRRQAEEAARKVPVRLLAPLVTCTLPAFGLLTVVPLLAASLQRLPL